LFGPGFVKILTPACDGDGKIYGAPGTGAPHIELHCGRRLDSLLEREVAKCIDFTNPPLDTTREWVYTGAV
jgi:hypothetical protein